ncbi:MAG TPA: phosphohydrolase [Syntrophomonas sp.]|jgi:predicted HD superfamily hydrolase involved in NAD metabolism|nr:phosphohydrolase [Syntrophomonas sp.]HCF71242.1 phosphohydrolase [Syntrophomonas sp.]
MIDENKAIEIISARLSPSRCRHSLEVARVARQMAEQYGDDSSRAYLTGLLHDYAKGIAGDELVKIAEANHLITDEVDRQVPDLLHAPVGAFLLERDVGINDADILQAVKCHTVGCVDMTTLDKIIYLADMIEPGRDYPGLERLRCLAERSMDRAMLYGLETTIKYCIDCGRILHPQTIAVRNWFLTRQHD